MSELWVTVASSFEANIYSATHIRGELSKIHEMYCDEARLHEQELNSDRPGRAFDSFGKGRHETSSPSSSKQQLSRKFAREISHYLDKARASSKLKQLILIAEPHFLGVLRASMGKELGKIVIQKISKDLTRQSVASIQKNLIS